MSRPLAVTGMTRSRTGSEATWHQVNSVHPGVIAHPGRPAGAAACQLNRALEKQTIRRLTKESLALFFASDSTYCTGSSLVVMAVISPGPIANPSASRRSRSDKALSACR
jgi:NAD(P)-dependent dehydrogenase (short-subunit alcohol dehydrogenase family)